LSSQQAVGRKANALLTRVLERDNERVEVIEGLIEDLRQEVEEHLEARKQALEEVRNM
jgi:HEPN domain-containing protein